MSTPLRGECTYCNRRLRLTSKGLLYRHDSVETVDGLRVLDECAGSGTEPWKASVSHPAETEIAWSWWERHGYYVWMAGVWVSGFIVGGAVVQILRNLAEGRGWLG